MRIDKIRIKNFRCFEEQEFNFHPQFNLIVGVNGTGKTSILDALSISQATWLTGLRNKLDQRNIRLGESRLILKTEQHESRYIEQYPVEIEAWGQVMGKDMHWLRSKVSPKGNTRYGQASELIASAKAADEAVRSGQNLTLPLIAYYGTMRLWHEPRDFQKASRISRPENITKSNQLSNFEGYRFSVDPRISVSSQVTWFARQAWITFQEGKKTWPFTLVANAILACVEGAKSLSFNPGRGELMLKIGNQDPQPFVNLSDGQSTMLAMIADIAQKAIWLNPHLGEMTLKETPGIVLIDELDLHLHPRWQRHVIEDLRKTFPKIQFICTTHSPQLIGQTKANEILLLGSKTPNPSQSYGMDSNWILRHIMDSPDREPEIETELESIFEAIENAEFDPAQAKIKLLKQKVGEHPELVEAEALISRYSYFEKVN